MTLSSSYEYTSITLIMKLLAFLAFHTVLALFASSCASSSAPLGHQDSSSHVEIEEDDDCG